MSEGVITQEVKTGPVRSSGYAIKLRRAINATIRPLVKEGALDSKQVNEELTRLNKALYKAMIERFEIPKDAVVNVTVRYQVRDKEFEIEDVKVDIYDKSDVLSRNVTQEVKRMLSEV